jgi:putative colanic acid biosynthesis acetyltransferase WcaF
MRTGDQEGAAIAEDRAPSDPAHDPMKRPALPLADRARRLLWNVCCALFFRHSPRPFFAWRAMVLRLFGARLGPTCKFYPKARIWAPWNLICEDLVAVGDGAELYNPSPLYMGSHCIVSQGAYICGATHEYNSPEFRFVHFPMRLGAYSWICARATVSPGVNVGSGAILALASVATRDLEPFGVYAGVPARKVKERLRSAVPKGDQFLGLHSF